MLFAAIVFINVVHVIVQFVTWTNTSRPWQDCNAINLIQELYVNFLPFDHSKCYFNKDCKCHVQYSFFSVLTRRLPSSTEDVKGACICFTYINNHVKLRAKQMKDNWFCIIIFYKEYMKYAIEYESDFVYYNIFCTTCFL